MSEEHVWRRGDLCTCTYGGTGHGVIYQVSEVSIRPRYSELTLVPIFAVMAKLKGRGKRKTGTGYCTPVSLVDMATAYAAFGNFIAEEARRRGAEDGPAQDA